MVSIDILIKLMLMTIAMLLAVALLGTLSVANAYEISGYMSQEPDDGDYHINSSFQGLTFYPFCQPCSSIIHQRVYNC